MVLEDIKRLKQRKLSCDLLCEMSL